MWHCTLDLYGFTKIIKMDAPPPYMHVAIPGRFDDPGGQISILRFRARNFDKKTKVANYEYIEE